MDIENNNLDKIQGFAYQNDVTSTLSSFATECGKKKVPFGFFLSDMQNKEGVVSVLKLTGFNGQPDRLITQIHKFWLERCGYDDASVKWAVLDYFLNLSACYVELPKVVTREGMTTPTFDKFIATKNVAIIAKWLGISLDTAEIKYGSKIKQFENLSYTEGKMYVIKLTTKDNEPAVSVPRNVMNIDQANIFPLFMISNFTKGLVENLSTGILKFSYQKDNNTVRELVTTLSKNIISTIYKDYPAFIEKILYGVDYNGFVVDGLDLSTKVTRGYIKLPELGASIYDESGCRSLNLMRLLSIEDVSIDAVDTTYIGVDLTAVIPKTVKAIQDTAMRTPNVLPKVYKDIVGEEPKSAQVPVMLESILTFINNRDMLLSTSYRRSLHAYMISNIGIFPTYLDAEVASISSVGGATNMGVTTIDDF